MSNYVYPKDVLPEINYKGPHTQTKRCGLCRYSHITNAGAVKPGLECIKIAQLFKEKNILNGNEQVDRLYGTCDLFACM